MMIELYALKPFVLGCFLTWFFMWKCRNYKKPKTFEIRSFEIKNKFRNAR